MRNPFLVVLLLTAALTATTPAAAQGCGPSNPGCIVPTAPVGTSDNRAASTQFVQQNLSSPTNLSSSIDAAFGSTRGSILERGASGWGIVPPGTSGLPWVSNGSGADPGYQALTSGGIASGTVANANLAPASAQNTVKGAAVSTSEADLAVPSCSTASSALTWTTNSGFGCNSISTLPSIAAFDTLCNPTSSGAVPIACQNGILHSKDMGAVGNGSTDDTTALQNWINACQTNGLVCRLDFGTYKITTALGVTSSITIEGVLGGNGNSTSVIQPSTSISGINVNTPNPVTFRDFAVNYASAASTSTNAISLTATGAANINSGSRFDRLAITNAGNAFSIGQAQYFVIRACLVQGIPSGGTGVTMDNSSYTNPDTGDSTITECTFTLPAAASNGVLINSFAGLRVVNNKIIAAGTGGTGINLNLKNGITSSLLKVIGNSIEGMSNGIILQRAGTTGSFTNVVIANNEFEPGAGAAAVNNPTDANGVWLNNVMISGNIIFGPTTSTSSFGYIVKAASGVQISSNLTISNSSTNGFQALATTGSNNCTLGPNGHGAGLFVVSDTGCTTTTTIAPN
jgi:hypothetical protein